ncbi:phosphonate transporter [Polymorphobacter sp.]|uniref:phosphonate transporter n=1 Tax=Polymorphobacter sp. TaxID=1909290 RepID=UPI003F7030B8
MNSFSTITAASLATLDDAALDGLPFGVIGLSKEGFADVYNATESRLAGLPRAKVIGAHFFDDIAQCMNNFMVAQRFEDESALDATLDYVLTLRMKPTPVKLRLLQSPEVALRYVLIERNV